MKEILAKEFFTVLYQPIPNREDLFYESRLIKPDPTDPKNSKKTKIDSGFYTYSEFLHLQESQTFASIRRKNEQGYNVYFGIYPRLRKRGQKDDVACGVCLYADVDAKDFLQDQDAKDNEVLEAILAIKPNVLKHIEQIYERNKIPPSILIDSGRGYQLYWLLKRVVNFPENGQRQALIKNIERLNKVLEQLFHGDHIGNVDRIFRYPGSYNRKPVKKGSIELARLPVNILQFNPDLRYPLETFHRLPPPEQPKPQHTHTPKATTATKIDDNTVLEKALKHPDFKALWEGNTDNYDSPSEADFALCCKLAFWAGKNRGQMDVLFRKSGLYREKWKDKRPGGTTYGWYTIDKAIKAQKEVYQPRSAEVGKATQIAHEINKQYSLKFNELTDRIHINGDCFTDDRFATIYCDLYDKGFRGQELIRQVILAEAAKTRFHPVKQYFEALKWNGWANIEQLSMYVSDKDNVFNLFLRKWLIGAVNKTYTGAQNPMLVLVGGQGIGKSHFVKWLCPLPELFLSSAIAPDNNDNKLRLCDRFIWEVGELGATTRRADIEALKWFLTLETVTVRRPYARFDIDKPALANFIGTINDEGTGFLNDSTGHRRFRPVLLTSLDWNYHKDCDIHQIWAEAVAAYKSGESSDLTKDEQRRLDERIEEDFQQLNPLEDLINTFFIQTNDPTDNIPSMQILQILYDNEYRGRGSKGDGMELARILKKMGVQKKRPGGVSTYYGIREKTSQEIATVQPVQPNLLGCTSEQPH